MIGIGGHGPSATFYTLGPRVIEKVTYDQHKERFVSRAKAHLPNTMAVAKKRSATSHYLQFAHSLPERLSSSAQSSSTTSTSAPSTAGSISAGSPPSLYSPVSVRSANKQSYKLQELLPRTRARIQNPGCPFKKPDHVLDPRTASVAELQKQMLSILYVWEGTLVELIYNEIDGHAKHSTGSTVLKIWLSKLGTHNSDFHASRSSTRDKSDWRLQQDEIHMDAARMSLIDRDKAIEVYTSHEMFLEGILLTCVLFPDQWSRVTELALKWGTKCTSAPARICYFGVAYLLGPASILPWNTDKRRMSSQTPETPPPKRTLPSRSSDNSDDRQSQSCHASDAVNQGFWGTQSSISRSSAGTPSPRRSSRRGRAPLYCPPLLRQGAFSSKDEQPLYFLQVGSLQSTTDTDAEFVPYAVSPTSLRTIDHDGSPISRRPAADGDAGKLESPTRKASSARKKPDYGSKQVQQKDNIRSNQSHKPPNKSSNSNLSMGSYLDCVTGIGAAANATTGRAQSTNASLTNGSSRKKELGNEDHYRCYTRQQDPSQGAIAHNGTGPIRSASPIRVHNNNRKF